MSKARDELIIVLGMGLGFCSFILGYQYGVYMSPVDHVEIRQEERNEHEIPETVEGFGKTSESSESSDEDIDIYVKPAINAADKPVIYVYGKEGQEVKVSLEVSDDSKLTCTYPEIDTDNSWTVTCEDNNMLSLEDYSQKFNYLYWEGLSESEYTIDEGFCVKGEDSGEFLNNALHKLGLNDREANEFIVYWLPKLESNAYNLISFDISEYEKDYQLKTEPVADNTLRVFMTFKGLEAPVEIKEQNLNEIRGDFEREGLTVVEWGGSELGSEVMK